ncbi:ALKBH7 family protein [Megaselia abdita]
MITKSQVFIRSGISNFLGISRWFCSSIVHNKELFHFMGKWPSEEKTKLLEDLKVIPNFITDQEEESIFKEVEPYLKRLHYESDHWDDAIHGFRETERKQWYPDNRKILDRVKDLAFNGVIMPYIHVLDLSADGVIKPHVDSTRYCGDTIAGISLLSQSVMRLVRTGDDAPEEKFSVDIFLDKKSLYIMSKTSRYKFTHEILAKENSVFKDKPVEKGRRISIICRNDP